MLRWLSRLLIVGLLLFVAGIVVSRFLNREEDFEDYDDTEEGFEFTETPVEIDVPASEAGPHTIDLAAAQEAPTYEAFAETPAFEEPAVRAEAAPEQAPMEMSDSLIDVNGIGPTYAARLNDAGIHSLSELASANADDIAEKIEVIGGRREVQDWIEQAQRMTAGGGKSGA